MCTLPRWSVCGMAWREGYAGQPCGEAITEWGSVLSEAGGEVERTKIALHGVKKKNILGMALHAPACFFWGRRWPAGGTAAILHNALIGRLGMRLTVGREKGGFVRQYYKVHYVNIAWGLKLFNFYIKDY